MTTAKATADQAIAAAEKYIGKPYGEGPGEFDCVRLVHQVWDDIGLGGSVGNSSTVSGTAAAFRANGREDSYGSAAPADLIVYGPYEHLAINIDGSQVISALGGVAGKPDQGVQISPISAIVDETGHPMTIKSVLHTGLAPGGGETSSTNPIDSLPLPLPNPLALPGDVLGALGAIPSQVAQGVLSTLFAWIPEFAANAGILLLVAVLFIMGVRRVLDAGEGSAT